MNFLWSIDLSCTILESFSLLFSCIVFQNNICRTERAYSNYFLLFSKYQISLKTLLRRCNSFLKIYYVIFLIIFKISQTDIFFRVIYSGCCNVNKNIMKQNQKYSRFLNDINSNCFFNITYTNLLLMHSNSYTNIKIHCSPTSRYMNSVITFLIFFIIYTI